MKRFLILSTVMLFVLTGNLFAQSTQETNRTNSKMQLSAGSGYYSGGVPIYAFMDFTVAPNLTVGPQIDFVFYYNFSFILSGRADYHFNSLLNLSDEWDVYAGATMGINFSRPTTFSAGVHGGGRWYWDKKWGVNLEVGGGTYFRTTVGISVRL
jgi:opacity protein-like surface antigen